MTPAPLRPACRPAPGGPVARRAATARTGLALCATLALLGGCGDIRDWDLRPGSGFSTAEAARQATQARPAPDARGIISYPSYQVAVARRGDSVRSLAERIGLPAAELARFNALEPDMPLNEGQLLVLPRRVSEPAGAAGPGRPDIAGIASEAIDRAPAAPAAPAAPTAGAGAAAAEPPFQVVPAPPPGARPAAADAAPAPGLPGGAEPVRHRVQRGESAYTIARRYNVTVRALAEWNGLGPDFAVREGQTLIIPVADPSRRAAAPAPATSPPGQGSPTPVPPSAAQPLPPANPPPAATPPATPPSPNLGEQRSGPPSRLAMPAEGRIIRGFQRGRNDGIDIAAPAGAPVRAAADGTVAAITRDTDQVTILVLRHEGNLLTVYANIDGVTVERGATVRRGQTIARVRAADPAFLHFEVREGFEAVDPVTFLQ